MIRRSEDRCEYCGKIVSCLGFKEDKEDVEYFIKTKMGEHHGKCKIKIREDRLNKLLNEDKRKGDKD